MEVEIRANLVIESSRISDLKRCSRDGPASVGWAEGLSVTGAGQPVSQINDRCPATPVTDLRETESGL